MQGQQLDNSEKRHLARKLRAREQASALEKLVSDLKIGMTLTNNAHNAWAILLEDASNPGQHRYQCFDSKGFSSHHTFKTLHEALKEAFLCGYRTQDDGALDRIAITPEWARGMAVQAIRDRYNSGQINWEEMLQLIREVDSVAG